MHRLLLQVVYLVVRPQVVILQSDVEEFFFSQNRIGESFKRAGGGRFEVSLLWMERKLKLGRCDQIRLYLTEFFSSSGQEFELKLMIVEQYSLD